MRRIDQLLSLEYDAAMRELLPKRAKRFDAHLGLLYWLWLGSQDAEDSFIMTWGHSLKDVLGQIATYDECVQRIKGAA